ncbi:leukocyte elastase inhibitor A-like isoform X1 [Amphibalanus amphitrite]|uniref:leukocyte elastase inhibitor A-like isoform X1 n=1 Tax=Amphibalanus amphitrite TaxID=1232801 RepID=UPI001C920361|nr:leukocyte elastase inhibitor A-like isoform X1 [Amphibalanus amphitrite]
MALVSRAGGRRCPTLPLSLSLLLLLPALVSASIKPGWWRKESPQEPEPRPSVPTALDLPLLQELVADPAENQAVSPFVMSSLMTQVCLGAGGTTRDEMMPILGLEDPETGAELDYLSGYQSAIEHLSSNTTNITVATFNGMYVRPGFSVRPSYRSTLRRVYGSDALSITSPEETAREINAAVAEVTRGKIAELVAANQLQGVDLVLVSALYFKALWQRPFVADDRPTPFLTAEGERRLTMMSLPDPTSLLYANLTQFEAVALPYSDPEYSLLLLRPAERSMESVQTLLDMLDTLDMADIYSQMYEISMHVTMPKFKIETDYSLTEPLTALGIQEIFSQGADFSQMTDERGVFVSDIIHKVFIEVTEEGTEAAGAGAVFFTRSMPMNFIVDRPFVAVVYNRPLGLNLFSAYVASPESAADPAPAARTRYSRPQLPKFLSQFPRRNAINTFDGSRIREFFSSSRLLGQRE